MFIICIIFIKIKMYLAITILSILLKQITNHYLNFFINVCIISKSLS